MRCLLWGWVLMLSGMVHAEGIVDVLERSQQQRLEQRAPADLESAAAQRVRASFARLIQLSPPPAPVELRLTGGGLYAEAVLGRMLVVSEAVGDLPEGERLLMLAHELGHLTLGHWNALTGLYLSFIPGEVRPETTDPVAARLGAQAHALSHRHEYEADAFGFALVRRLGFGVENAAGLLTRQGVQADSATHPGTRRRLAQLRALDAQLTHAATRAGEAEAVAVRAAGE